MGTGCECWGWCHTEFDYSEAGHHHKRCPKYTKEKFDYILYFSDDSETWNLVPDNPVSIAELLDVEDITEEDLSSSKYKRLSLTDEEFSEYFHVTGHQKVH